jgi:hypothetical protein
MDPMEDAAVEHHGDFMDDWDMELSSVQEESEDEDDCWVGIGSPHACYRKSALQTLRKQATRMKKRVSKKQYKYELDVGDVVRLRVHDVDRARLDPTSITVVVVEKLEKGAGVGEVEMKYRLATTDGVLPTLYGRFDLEYKPHATPGFVGLASVLHDWDSTQCTPLRTAVRRASVTGGQGMLSCLCRGSCMSNKCSCFKANRKCNSRCHKRNCNCENNE